jgi:anthranilate phosphoribosyltransferase
MLVEKQMPVDELPPLPSMRDAASTAVWIQQALRGEQPVPASIAEQVHQCLFVAKDLQSRRQ